MWIISPHLFYAYSILFLPLHRLSSVSDLYKSTFLPSGIGREAPRRADICLLRCFTTSSPLPPHITEVCTVIPELRLDAGRAGLHRTFQLFSWDHSFPSTQSQVHWLLCRALHPAPGGWSASGGPRPPSRNCQALSCCKSPQFNGEVLSQDDDPEGQCLSQSLRALLCFLFTSGSWDFLLLLAVHSLCFIWHLSLEPWDGYLSSVGPSIEIPGNKPRKGVGQKPPS